MRKTVNISKAPKPIGPYSQAVYANGTLYVSGQIPINPFTGKLIQGDIKTQTKQVLENLKTILKEVDMDLSNVVKCSIFITDMNNFALINEIYSSYFTENPPARETAQVAKLPMDVDIVISLIATED